jgi:SPP1 family predicted phage head-tail adaptor
MRIIGKLDRRITIEKRTLTKDSAGGIVESWAEQMKLWAERMDKSGNEKTAANADKSESGIDWRIRFVPLLRGLNGASGYRVNYNGSIFNIHGVFEEGRRDGMILKTLATEGLS